MKFLFNKNIINKWKAKPVPWVRLKNISKNFTKNFQNLNIENAQECWNVTRITKIKLQRNKRYNMKKN